ncbi:MAG: CoA transferase, partial [Candidatus Tectomicrobia bacterium]|nr:CoA transferase [Candidatus Tectomicrobia bacterium]
GITLNINHPKGQEIARQLVSLCDVVIDKFTPRVMEKWGLDYKSLVRVRPDIIVINMPMQGLTGPRRDFLGFGAFIQALAGISHLTGFPEDDPVGTGTNYPDFSCNPYHAAFAILAALLYRKKSGKGQHIDLSQYQSTASVLGSAILDYTVNGRIQQRMGNRHSSASPHGAYRCKGDDRWCVIAVFTDQEWASFCRVIGTPPWAKEERFQTLLGRVKQADELDWLVESWTVNYTPEEVMIMMQEAGVAAGVVRDIEDLMVRDPQMKARRHYVVLDHPETGSSTYDSAPFKLSLTPGKLRSPAPLIGQHNDDVYKQLLGFSEEKIAKLVEERVIY